MTNLEKKAALAVAAATAGVILSGVSLLRRHARYLAKKAAATFDPQEEDEELTKEALAAGSEDENLAKEARAAEAEEEDLTKEAPAAEAEAEEQAEGERV